MSLSKSLPLALVNIDPGPQPQYVAFIATLIAGCVTTIVKSSLIVLVNLF